MRTKQIAKKNNYPRSFKSSAKNKAWYNRLQSRRYARPKTRGDKVAGISKKDARVIQSQIWDLPPSTTYPTAAYKNRPTRAAAFQRPGGYLLAATAIQRAYKAIKQRRTRRAARELALSRGLPANLFAQYLP